MTLPYASTTLCLEKGHFVAEMKPGDFVCQSCPHQAPHTEQRVHPLPAWLSCTHDFGRGYWFSDGWQNYDKCRLCQLLRQHEPDAVLVPTFSVCCFCKARFVHPDTHAVCALRPPIAPPPPNTTA